MSESPYYLPPPGQGPPPPPPAPGPVPQAPMSAPYGAPVAPAPYGAPPGAAPWSPYPAQGAAPPRRTNPWLIAALGFGVIGGVLFAVVFGIIGLVQIRSTGQKGRGLAIAGLTLAGVWTIAIAAFVVALLTGGIQTAKAPLAGAGSRATTGSSVPSSGASAPGGGTPSANHTSGDVLLDELVVGDCIEDVSESQSLFDLPAVPCSRPHRAEVVGLETMTDAALPEEKALDRRSTKVCAAKLRSYSPSTRRDVTIDLNYLEPNKESWQQGDREIICLAHFQKPRTRSIKG